ncbi:hypothetical protein [Streptomyces sp. TE33382]
MRGALGDRAPVAIRETTVPKAFGARPERSRDSVLLDFDDRMIGEAKGERPLTRALVAQGMVPLCSPRSETESGTQQDAVAQSIATAWVLGEEPRPLDRTMHSAKDQNNMARPVWKKFAALPKAEQRQRISAMHAAAVSCSDDALSVLNGGPVQ